jgi:4-alpha-glucanotransferase
LVAAHEFTAQATSALMLVQADDMAGEIEPLNIPGTDREQPNWRRRVGPPVEQLASSELARCVIKSVIKSRERAVTSSPPGANED